MIEQYRDVMTLMQIDTHPANLLHAASGGELNPKRLKKLSKHFHGEPCVFDDSSHGESVNRIVSGNDYESRPVGENNMAALADDFKSGLFQSANGLKVVDAG